MVASFGESYRFREIGLPSLGDGSLGNALHEFPGYIPQASDGRRNQAVVFDGVRDDAEHRPHGIWSAGPWSRWSVTGTRGNVLMQCIVAPVSGRFRADQHFTTHFM